MYGEKLYIHVPTNEIILTASVKTIYFGICYISPQQKITGRTQRLGNSTFHQSINTVYFSVVANL